MSFDPTKVPERLIKAAQQRTLVPLIGAGVSRQTTHPFPTWLGLLNIMKARALKEKRISTTDADEMEKLLNRGQFLMVAEDLRSRLETGVYTDILRETFDKQVKPAAIHKALFALDPPLVLTTNYDRLLEDAYADAYRLAAIVTTYKDVVAVQNSFTEDRQQKPPIIFKIHGSIANLDEIICTEKDYRNLTYDQLGYRAVLSAIFITHNVLMLGFSFTDQELILLLEAHRHSLKYKSSLHYIFLPDGEVGDVETRRLREDFGIEIVPFKPSKTYKELLEFVNFLASKINRRGSAPKSSAKKAKKKPVKRRK
jgi:hypothetical protein